MNQPTSRGFHIPYLLIGTVLLLVSCSKDYFDPENYRSFVQATFPIEDVDPQHDWATIGSAQVTINVGLKSGKTYTAHIYDQNPIKPNGTLSLLGQGTVADGGSLTISISYPLANPIVFLALFDAEGYMTVYDAHIEDGQATLAIVQASQQVRRSARRSHGSSFEFAEQPADTDYKTAAPADAVDLSQYSNYGYVYWPEYRTPVFQSFTVQPGTRYLQLDHGVADIYFLPGDHIITGAYIAGDTKFFLLPGAHVTFQNELNQNNDQFKFYVADGATLTAPNGISYNFWLYNRGEITTSKMTQYAKGCLLNEGRMVINEVLQIANQQSQVVNYGELSCASLSVEGSSHLLNLNQMTVSGTTSISSNNCSWVNEGTYTTATYDYTAGSTNVINNCHLIVTGDMKIHLGESSVNCFQNNGGASVECGTFYINVSTVKMGAGSVIKVKGTATMHQTKADYSIQGVGDDYAMFQAERIVMGQEGQGFEATYRGKLYVASNNHFAQGYSGTYPYYRLLEGAAFTTYDGANIHTTTSGCAQAFSGKPAQAPAADDFSLRYCFEDNFPQVGDYDFNDAVITVTPTINGKNVTLRLSLDAVGASEQLAGALRIKGLKVSDIASYRREGNMDEGLPSNVGQRNIDTDEDILPRSMTTTDDVVLPLFNNAHWSLGHAMNAIGSIRSWFYNTVKRGDSFDSYLNDVEPAVVTYHFELTDESKAAYFTEQYLDPFIVEDYNGSLWEVHTVPFKTEEVLSAYSTGANSAYTDNFPWAICVPGNSFKYPVEWQSIGMFKGDSGIDGAYKEPGHSFAEWARDRQQATDWYNYPTASLVYE